MHLHLHLRGQVSELGSADFWVVVVKESTVVGRWSTLRLCLCLSMWVSVSVCSRTELGSGHISTNEVEGWTLAAKVEHILCVAIVS